MTEQIPSNPTVDLLMTTRPIFTEHEQVPHGEVASAGQRVVELALRPAYVSIEAEIAVMQEEASATMEAMNALYDTSSDDVRQNIDQLEQHYIAAVEAAEAQGQDRPVLVEFLDAAVGVPEEFKAGILASESAAAKIEAAEKRLEKYAPEKTVEVRQKAAELEAGLDYDKVVAQAFADDDNPTPSEGVRDSSINLLYDVSKVIGVRKLLESGVPLTYERLKSVERSLEVTAAACEEKGLMRRQSEVAAEGEAFEPLTEEQMVDIEAHLKDVYELRTKYKKYDKTIQDKIRVVLGITRQMREYDDEIPTDLNELYIQAKIIYNDSLGAAINRRLMQKLNELPADEFEADVDSEVHTRLVERLRDVDASDAVSKLEISGSFENLPFKFSEAELKDFLSVSVPAAALASVKRVQFRSMTEEEDEEDSTLGFHAWSDEVGGPEIVISDTQVRMRYQEALRLFADEPDSERYAQLNAKERMLRTITHEFGHELHEILPVAILKRWEGQRAADSTNITEYVKSRHESNHVHRYMEDFADTMALFINQPEVLAVISPARFSAMQQVFEEAMPQYAETTKKLQDHRIAFDKIIRASRGISDDQVRSTYLRHETA